MSSESEDEFQSADEGSDFEDSYPLNSQGTTATKSEVQPVTSCPAPTKEVIKDNMNTPGSIKDTKTELSKPVTSKATPTEEFDADDESEEEIQEEPQTKTFDDKVTNLMSALDQLSLRVNKQLTKPVSKTKPTDEMVEEDDDEDEGEDEDEDGHNGSVEEDQAKEREIMKEEERKRELEREEEKKRELEKEEERKREQEKEEERKREEKRKQELEKEEEKKRQIEKEAERKREIEREEEKKRQILKEEERQRQLEQEEQRKREFEREEKRKKELEREELRKKEIEEENKRKMEREEEAKRMEEEKEEERKRELEKEEERKRELEKEEERKRELEKEEERKSEIKREQEKRGEQEKNAGTTQESGTVSQKAKPIRESKIGMKKPREKLGERMGARRLGAKVEKKPLESISSDSFKKSEDKMWNKEESQTDSAEAKQREEERQKEEKWRKQQQWEEQQKRWQQINEGEDKKEEEDTSWGGGWGGWGTSLLTAASTFTREVGRGVGTVMETVEGTLGVPDPETLAREIAERDKEIKEKLAKSEQSASREKTPEGNTEAEELESETGYTPSNGSAPTNQNEGSVGYVPSYGLGGLSSLGSLVSGVSGALETASSKVLMGGLDTLEVIGRKAMTVIQEGDPGLRKKRAFLTSSKPNLSMILQDARQRAAQEESDQRDGIQNKESGLFQRPNFDQAWENTEGPVHVEALSLVAKQCESKMNTLLQSMPPYLVDRIQNSNLTIKKTCEMDEESQLEGDFATQVTKIVSQIRLPLHSQKIREAWAGVEETASLIEEKKNLDWTAVEKEVYLSLALLIAQLAALTHKGSELALITPGSDPHAIANSFRELSCLVCAGMENTVDNICGVITAKASAADPDVNNTITNMYLQGASGNSCVQEGMMFLSSVLQYANTKLLAADPQGQYARSQGLAGVMVWSLETDDFSGSCTGRPYNLIRSMTEGFLDLPFSTPVPPTSATTQTTSGLATPACGDEYFVPDLYCNKYWQCEGGTPHPRECPEGLVWNTAQAACTWPFVTDTAHCLMPGQTMTPPATATPTAATESSTSTSETSTKSTSHTSSTVSLSETSAPTSQTPATTATSQAPSASPASTTTITTAPIPPDCDPASNYFVSHQSCKKFWWCVEGRAVLGSCYGDLVWDQDARVCVSAGHRDTADCGIL